MQEEIKVQEFDSITALEQHVILKSLQDLPEALKTHFVSHPSLQAWARQEARRLLQEKKAKIITDHKSVKGFAALVNVEPGFFETFTFRNGKWLESQYYSDRRGIVFKIKLDGEDVVDYDTLNQLSGRNAFFRYNLYDPPLQVIRLYFSTSKNSYAHLRLVKAITKTRHTGMGGYSASSFSVTPANACLFYMQGWNFSSTGNHGQKFHYFVINKVAGIEEIAVRISNRGNSSGFERTIATPTLSEFAWWKR